VEAFDRRKRPEEPDVLIVERFYEDLRRECSLSRFTEGQVVSGRIVSPTVHRPGLALVGFTAKYPYQAYRSIGRGEGEYLKSLSRRRAARRGAAFNQGSPGLFLQRLRSGRDRRAYGGTEKKSLVFNAFFSAGE